MDSAFSEKQLVLFICMYHSFDLALAAYERADHTQARKTDVVIDSSLNVTFAKTV